MTVKQGEQKETGRIKLTDTRELVASLVDNERLDLRVRVDGALQRMGKARLQVLSL